MNSVTKQVYDQAIDQTYRPFRDDSLNHKEHLELVWNMPSHEAYYNIKFELYERLK